MCGRYVRRSNVSLTLARKSRMVSNILRLPARSKIASKAGRATCPMPKTILLVSRDENLQNSRALVLEGVGYRTIKTGSLTSAVQLSSHCQMSIIGHTFNPKEQDDFIERVHESNPSVFVLCLRFGLTQPRALLTAVDNCFATQPGGSRVCILEESNLIAWPKRAS